jgi:putative peptide zinc metalloprotease protein
LVGGQRPCIAGVPTQVFPVVDVTDDRTPATQLTVEVRWTGFAQGVAKMTWDGFYYGVVGPVPYPGVPNEGGVLNVRVVARDADGAQGFSTVRTVTVLKCGV